MSIMTVESENNITELMIMASHPDNFDIGLTKSNLTRQICIVHHQWESQYIYNRKTNVRTIVNPSHKHCYKAVGSGEAGEALASPVFQPNSNISALTFF